MATQTTEQLLASLTTRRIETFTINGQEWRIRSISAREEMQWRRASYNKDGTQKDDAEARLIVLCVVGDDDKPRFNEGHLAALMEADSETVAPLYFACMNHCGLGKSIEDAIKKSSPTQNSEPS